jgi:1-acyl-sn-glycerol-3-phosphate acyltransferase
MVLIKTISAFAITILTIIIFTPIGLFFSIFSFLGLRKPVSWVTYKIAQGWARTIIFTTGSTIEVEGRARIPKDEGLCFVSNHVGIFDIVIILAYAGRPFGFIAKRELLYLPFINMWISILGGLFIDRKNIRNALKTINHGIERIQKGACMLIFPEGTRSKGRGLLPFRSGAIKLATNSHAPIVPIAITGSYEVFEKNRRVNAAFVRVVFCPPIITAEASPEDRRAKLTEQVRSSIESALNSGNSV